MQESAKNGDIQNGTFFFTFGSLLMQYEHTLNKMVSLNNRCSPGVLYTSPTDLSLSIQTMHTVPKRHDQHGYNKEDMFTNSDEKRSITCISITVNDLNHLII